MSHPKILGVFALAMLNLAAIVSLRNLPLAATYGLGAIFFYTVAALVFFIPSALVCAELAAAWTEAGGLYAWVKAAFGPKWGLIAIWTSWMVSIAWFPTILSFCGATIAYAIRPELADNPAFMLVVMLSILWGITILNFFGMRVSSWFSTFGVIVGTIVPTILILALAFAWIQGGHPIAMPISASALLPEMQWGHWVFLTGIILAFEGMEVTAFHVQNTKNPQRDYPRALFLSSVLILLICVFGTLAMSVVVSPDQINLVSGVMQVFERFFEAFGLSWMVPVLAFLLFVGILATINAWVIGPAKGVLAAAEEGYLPKWLQKTCGDGDVPMATLLVQAAISSIFACLLLFMPSVQSAYWLLTALTTQLALLMYVMIFASVIVLRYREPNRVRPFQIPGGKVGLWIVAGMGLLTCVAVFCLSFVPPDKLEIGNVYFYEGFLFLGLFLLLSPPLLFLWRNNK